MSAIVCVTSYGFGTNASTIPTRLVGAFPDVRMTGMSGYLSRSVSASCSPSSEPGVWISENTRYTCSPAPKYGSPSAGESASITSNPESRNSSAMSARTKTSSSTTRIRAGRGCSSAWGTITIGSRAINSTVNLRWPREVPTFYERRCLRGYMATPMVEARLLHARDQALRAHLDCGLEIDPIVIAIRECDPADGQTLSQWR